MNEASNVATVAAIDIENFLKEQPATLKVQNVEEHEIYRQKDIDLLWFWKDNSGKEKMNTIEIKGDRYHRTGNYFLETISNKSKGTPGCFIYTEADYVFYYFIYEKELHILPMPETKNWFLKNIDSFVERETSTPVGKEYYITVGKLVNRKLLQNNVKGAKIVKF